MKIGSLCTGYGGLDLAVESYFNAETIWCAEFDKYASQVIEKRFAVPNHGNIKNIDWGTLPSIDILTAGYPCQPFSHAGERKGIQDERHIFPFIAEAISVLRPKFVVLENVRGHLSLGLKEVLQRLTEIGYDAKWTTVRASDVGAPHRRERIFIVANPIGEGFQRSIETGYGFAESGENAQCTNTDGFGFTLVGDNSGTQRNQRQSQSKLGQLVETVSPIDAGIEFKPYDGQMQELGKRFTPRREMQLQDVPSPLDNDKLNPKFVEYMMGLTPGWVTDVELSRSQQLKILGNGVVPQQAHYALELLLGDACG